jgi:hypothetical protein
MNIEVKSEEEENLKNNQNNNPHLTETKSHENLNKNFPINQQANNLNFFEENLNQRKINRENNHEINLNPQSGNQ